MVGCTATGPREAVMCIPALFLAIYSARTHTEPHQVLSCQLVSHKSAVKPGTNVFISVSIYCHPKHSHENTHLSPCPPLHLHPAGKGKTQAEISESLHSASFLRGDAGFCHGLLSSKEGLIGAEQETRILRQSYIALNSPTKAKSFPYEVQLTACNHMELKPLVLIHPL